MKTLQNATVAVTGGLGFIGSHLVRRLLGEAANIRIIDRKTNNDTAYLPNHPSLSFYQLDIGLATEEELSAALSGVDYLFHLAAFKHNNSEHSPYDIYQGNIWGTEKLLACAAKANISKVVFTSSLYAYGTNNAVMCEEHPPSPTTSYGISKLCGEHMLFKYVAQNDFDGVALRYFFTYGPFQHPGMGYKSVITKNFNRAISNEPMIIHGDGLQQMDYIYIDDVIEATIRAMSKPLTGELLNISSGRSISILELTKLMGSICNTPHQISHIAPDATARTKRSGDNKKAMQLLDWKPDIGLEEGLRHTYQWIKDSNAAH